MTLVRILDRIEQSGWIERRRDPSDRRVWRLHLLPTAEPILKRIWAIADTARNEALARLDATQVEQLLQLLDKVHGNLSVLVPNAMGAERRNLGNDATDTTIASPATNAIARSHGKA